MGKTQQLKEITLAPWQHGAINSPWTHTALISGIACGKTFTGSQYAIFNIINHPEKTGFIGANTYDQLSQATLREFMFWLDWYGFDYVIDQKPKREWKQPKKFKDYSNIISIYNPLLKVCTTVFTRILERGFRLRGNEFSWYWIDESRDTPRDTHDVIMSRLRETNYIRGLVTTTPNDEDWVYERFVTKRPDNLLFGSIHCATIESVNYGIITQDFYDMLLKTYDEVTAQQELFGMHVNVLGNRAYYAASNKNASNVSPWGDLAPDPTRPLIVGCDFNFQPAPCVWMVGQLGPETKSPYGTYWSEHIHWFGEISGTSISTPEMTMRLIGQFPGYFYTIYGDASGAKGTTSNAGETDYAQIGLTMQEYNAVYSIIVDDSNPRVKDRVESMNAMFKNAAGVIRQTYNPNTCPYFAKDLKSVGWRKTIAMRGTTQKLDDKGDHNLTHASDGAGYAVRKMFPLGRSAYATILNNQSANIAALRKAF